MGEIKTADLYESAYYLVNGCEIAAIEGRNFNGQIVCNLTMTGTEINELQCKYFQGTVQIDLFAFRRAYSQLLNYLSDAKKKLRKELAEGNAV